jgi:glyoxylase-like metal-dependent hydrolase (beta-lactamase superfamily II)
VVTVVSGGKRLLCTGDAVLDPIQVSRPEWFAAFDLRPEQAVTTRRKLLAGAADEDMLPHGAHFPWPGLGHVVCQDHGFRWEPIHQTT